MHSVICITHLCYVSVLFFFNDTATTEIYTLSLHDALPISRRSRGIGLLARGEVPARRGEHAAVDPGGAGGGPVVPEVAEAGQRSEEHTSELQSPCNLVCRLLLEKKKKTTHTPLSTLRAYPP